MSTVADMFEDTSNEKIQSSRRRRNTVRAWMVVAAKQGAMAAEALDPSPIAHVTVTSSRM